MLRIVVGCGDAAILIFSQVDFEHLSSGRLKVVSGEKEGGLKTGLIDRGWYGTVALEAEKIRRLASGS